MLWLIHTATTVIYNTTYEMGEIAKSLMQPLPIFQNLVRLGENKRKKNLCRRS
jgi:hypothetical protein